MRVFILFFLLWLSSLPGFSQYCGNSGPAQCTSPGILTEPGFAECPCVIRNQNTDLTVEYKNYALLDDVGFPLMLDSMKVESVTGLPSGICWSSNKVDNVFMGGESGCVRLVGNTADPAGQYKLTVMVRAYVSAFPGGYSTNIETFGIKVILRLVDDTVAICPNIDSTQTLAYEPFPYTLQTASIVKGKVYRDRNLNNVFDGNDSPIRNQLIRLSNDIVALTNDTGDYSTYAPVGSYTIAPDTSAYISNYTVSPTSISLNIPTVGQQLTGNDFAVDIPAGTCLGTLAVTPFSVPPRPGFHNAVRLRFKNIMSDGPATQTIRFNYDSVQNFYQAIPTPSLIDSVQNFVEWHSVTVQEGGYWDAWIAVTTPVSANIQLGQTMAYSATVSGSSCSSFNSLYDYQEETLVGSFDPNDKAVSPVGIGSTNAVLPSTPLTYLVRFQNTGTYLAERVVIVDTISPHLNLSSLQVTAASHNYEVEIRPGREVRFIFNQIMLPDSNSNEPESHGYVQYRIKPNANYINLSIVNNRADIYFDFNPPILTNTTLTTLDENINTVGIAETKEDNAFTVYPNPNSTGTWNLLANEQLLGKQLWLTDISGKVLYQSTLNSTLMQLALPQVSSGIYLLKVGSAVRKLVKE